MTEAVKEFMERMWRARGRDNQSTEYCSLFILPFISVCLSFVVYRSCRSKGLAQERSRVTCSIKIKIKITQTLSDGE